MSRTIPLALLGALLVHRAPAAAQPAAHAVARGTCTSATPLFSKWLDDGGAAETERFEMTVGRTTYVLTQDGMLQQRRPDGRSRSVRIARKGNDWWLVERAWCALRDGDLLLAYEVTDLEGESTHTEVFRLDAGRLALRWRAYPGGFNLGPALVVGDTAYLTTIGTVTKLDLRTGREIWRRYGLYRPHSQLDLFALPIVRGDTLVIPSERADPGFVPDTLRLLRSTGRVVGAKVGVRRPLQLPR
jgi:hypothetical protein